MSQINENPAAETRPILTGRADWIGSHGQMLHTCWGECSRSGGTLWTVSR